MTYEAFDKIYRDVWSSMPSSNRLWRFMRAIEAFHNITGPQEDARDPVKAREPSEDAKEPDMRAICEALGFDPTNHHNAAKCPYCRPSEDAKDAARYRWIKDNIGSGKKYSHWFFSAITDFDEAIDFHGIGQSAKEKQ